MTALDDEPIPERPTPPAPAALMRRRFDDESRVGEVELSPKHLAVITAGRKDGRAYIGVYVWLSGLTDDGIPTWEQGKQSLVLPADAVPDVLRLIQRAATAAERTDRELWRAAAELG